MKINSMLLSLARFSLLLIAAMAASPGWATTYVVQVGSGDSFTPPNLTINAGDSVTFYEPFVKLSDPHNVHADDNSFRCAKGCDGDGHGGNGDATNQGFSDTLTFNTPGTIGYQCDVHAAMGMVGTITVQAAGGTGTGNLPITAGFTGAWYDPLQSGHGLLMEVLPGNQLVAYWYTFTPDGQQTWFGGAGPITNDTAVVSVYQGTGGRWIPNFDPTKFALQPWGTLTITFSDCNHGRVDFVSTVPGYGSNHMDLTRITQPAGTSCP
jgi:plastocyanin